ncbi:MAG: choice-of-anchor R domain-containing protein, partial [Prosthecobacter sp.]
MSLRPLLLAAIAGLFAANASAAVLFSTLAQSNGAPAVMFDTDYRLASDFQTQASTASITGLTLQLSNVDSISHSFVAKLFSDASGTPGAELTSFSTQVIAAGVSGVNQLFSHPGYSLAANTNYWVVLEMLENTSTDNPIWSGNTSGGIDGGGSFLEITSTKAQSSFDAGASWGDSIPVPFLFIVIGVVAGPEPSRAG